MVKKVLTLVAPIATVAVLGLSGAATADTVCAPGQTNPKYCTKHCVVPNLRGDTVDQAGAELRAHDCTLGKVHHSRGHHGVGNGHVYKQNPKKGTIRPVGFPVEIWIQSAKKHHHHHHHKKHHHKK